MLSLSEIMRDKVRFRAEKKKECRREEVREPQKKQKTLAKLDLPTPMSLRSKSTEEPELTQLRKVSRQLKEQVPLSWKWYYWPTQIVA